MRRGLARCQLLWRFPDALGAATAQEHAVVQEELQQAQVGIAQVASQEEVSAQPGVQIFTTLYSRPHRPIDTRRRSRKWNPGLNHAHSFTFTLGAVSHLLSWTTIVISG